jgi:hypothetical protein
MELDHTYKNLDIEDCNGTDNSKMKEKLKKEYYRRILQTFNTELKENKIRALNTLAVTVLVYSFGIVSWLRREIEMIRSKTRKPLTTKESTT